MGFIQTVGRTLAKHSPVILTSVSVVGVFATAVLASKATIEAKRRLAMEDSLIPEKLAPKQVVQITWDLYIPAAVMGVTTAACIIGVHGVHTRRQAALMSIYSLTEAALKEYKDKVIETIGENKERKIREDIDQDHLDHNPVSTKEVLLTGTGEMLCYDSLSGRYFKSDMETLRRIQNDLNERIINFMYVSVNDLYTLLGIPDNTLGDQMGWTTDRLLKMEFDTMLADVDGKKQPCLVINYEQLPITNYFKSY